MKERPILMSGPLVRALLDGRKTQTRRVVQPSAHLRAYVRGTWGSRVPTPQQWNEMAGTAASVVLPMFLRGETGDDNPCPYGQPGDRLWVRETHYRWTGCGDAPPDWVRHPHGDRYQSRGYVGIPEHDNLYRSAAAAVKVPSIHMPRWASRITLEITGVRVERLQEITKAGARAEGVTLPECAYVGQCNSSRCPSHREDAHRAAFQQLWDSLNAERGYGWETNPWVWVLEFKRTPE